MAGRPEVLRVEDLRVTYGTDAGPVRAVDGVTFTIYKGERFGLVGESGSGKSTMANAILRLLKAPGRIDGGRMYLGDTDILGLSEEHMREIRWTRISLVMQGAMSSLNPTMRVREQIADGIEAHADSRHAARGM